MFKEKHKTFKIPYVDKTLNSKDKFEAQVTENCSLGNVSKHF